MAHFRTTRIFNEGLLMLVPKAVFVNALKSHLEVMIVRTSNVRLSGSNVDFKHGIRIEARYI